MFYLMHYLYKKFCHKISFINKIVQFIISTRFYLFFNQLLEENRLFNVKQYTLFTSTKLGFFIYASIYMRIVRFLGLVSMLLMVTLYPLMQLLLHTHKDSYIINLLASPFVSKLFFFLGVFGWLINFFYLVFVLLLYIRYSKQLIKK